MFQRGIEYFVFSRFNHITMRFILTGLLLFSLSLSMAQVQDPAYKQMMYDFNINFYTVCDSAEAYFSRIDRNVKGSGYKPFMRWKHENEGKYYPSGNRLVDHYGPYKTYERLAADDKRRNGDKLFENGLWNELGPNFMGQITGHYAAGIGRVEFVEVNRNNPQQIYMGSRSGGLWRTSDEGATWSHHSDFLPASGVNTVSASPTNFDSILVNVRSADNGTSFGIYRSTDGGQTYAPTVFTPSNVGFGGLGTNFQIYIIEYHPRVPNLVFVGTSKGIFRSTDNMQTWTRLINDGDIYDIEFHPTDNNIVYIYDGYYWGTNRNRILKSTDQGLSYTNLMNFSTNNNAKIKISVSPICPDCIWAGSDYGFWKSTDQGVTFTTIQSPAPSGVSLYTGVPNDQDTSKVVSGYVDLFRSSDGGRNFSKATWWSLGSAEHGGGSFQNAYNNSSVYIHADNNYLDCVNGVYYACTDGFLCKSEDSGLTWEKLSLSVATRENYRLGQSQSNQYLTILGSQDNGTSIKKESGWFEIYGADGMESFIHPLNENWMFCTTQNGGRRRTLDGGVTTSGIAPAGHSSAWVAPMFYDPNNHMTAYTFGNVVYKTTNFGTSWVTLGSPTTFTGVIEVAAIAYNNTSVMAISQGQYIELSTDGGTTFTNIKNSLPNKSIRGIAFDPTDDQTMVIVYDGYENNGTKVYITHDQGATWQNISYNLGNMPCYSVVIDHSHDSYIYIGAAIGIYKMAMGELDWDLYNPGLPNVSVKELEIHWGSNTLKAASWGRGLWEYALVDRNDYPAIVKTSTTTTPTFIAPKVTMDQFVTSEIEYSGNLTSVYVAWALNAPNFNSTNVLPMSLVSGNIWRTTTTLPNSTVGDKVYFKVFAVGDNQDTTETYKFMYELHPYEFCAASGESANGNLYINRLRLGSIDRTSANNAYTFYNNDFIHLYTDSSYTITGNCNTNWGSNDFVAWIDYNNDAEFTTNERVMYRVDIGAYQAANTFTVPNDAVLDTLRMRVRLGYWGGFDNPCGTTLGEVEDYPIIMRKAPNLAFTGNTAFCVGSDVELSYSGSNDASSIGWELFDGTNYYYFTGNSFVSNTLPVGTYDVSVSGVKYGTMFSKNFPAAFTVDAMPSTADAGTDLFSCTNDLVLSLNATAPTLGTGAWSGSATFSASSSATSDATVAATGVYTFTWTTTNGACTSTDQVEVSYNGPSNIATIDGTSGSCVVSDNDWQHIFDVNGNLLVSLNTHGQDLGAVTATVHIGSPTSLAGSGDCSNPATAYMGRSYDIVPTIQPTTPVDVRLYFTATDYSTLAAAAAANNNGNPCDIQDDISALSDVQITKYATGGSPGGTGTYLAQTANGSAYGADYIQLSTPSFSSFFMHGGPGGSTLPVSLTRFSATAVNNQFIQLSWATASETNNKGFYLLRSEDAQHFETLTWVDGQGNSLVEQQYSFNDANVLPNKLYYYKLQQLDFDGRSNYSHIVAAALNKTQNWIIGQPFPNPTSQSTSIQVFAEDNMDFEVMVYNQLGQLIELKQYNTSTKLLELNTASWSEGIYLVVLKNELFFETRRLLIQR